MTTHKMTNTIFLASFDIGKKNFAFCVEEIDLDVLDAIDNIPKQDRYHKDGSCTPLFHHTLKQVCKEGKIVLLENIDLTAFGGIDKTQYLDPSLFINMTIVLDKYKSYWDKCLSFIVEQQMAFGNRRNVMALKLGQHCLSYFIFHYASFKQAVEFPSYYKTKVLGASKKMSKHERKSWAVTRAMDILSDRDDTDGMNKISSRKKKDDFSDTIVQLQAFKYLVFIDKSL